MALLQFALIFVLSSLLSSAYCAGIPSNATTDTGHTLVGFTKHVYKGVIDLDECYDKCVSKQFPDGTKCKSGEFYGTDHECLLNSETKTTQPAAYQPEPITGVTYFEVA